MLVFSFFNFKTVILVWDISLLMPYRAVAMGISLSEEKDNKAVKGYATGSKN